MHKKLNWKVKIQTKIEEMEKFSASFRKNFLRFFSSWVSKGFLRIDHFKNSLLAAISGLSLIVSRKLNARKTIEDKALLDRLVFLFRLENLINYFL